MQVIAGNHRLLFLSSTLGIQMQKGIQVFVWITKQVFL